MTTINQLSAVDLVSSSDQVPIYSSTNGDARKASMSVIKEYMQEGITAADDKITQYAAPLTGTTVQVTDDSDSIWLILTPAGTLAALTIKVPTLANSVDKQEILVNCTQIITSLTVDDNDTTVVGAPTTLAAANAFFRLRFDEVLSTWYRIG
jgi:hypothetical protein